LDWEQQEDLKEEHDDWVKNFALCDHCQKRVLKENIFLQDETKRLNFCSLDCQQKWNVYGQEWLAKYYPSKEENYKKPRKNKVWRYGKRIEENIPWESRKEIINLGLRSEELTSFLKLTGFTNLRDLDISYNKLTDLNISKLSHLASINASNNLLTSLDFLKKLPNPKKLKSLHLRNNNFVKQDLNSLEKLTELIAIELGNNNKSRIEKKIYNRFYGSLKPFQYLNKLEILDISNTDLDSGIEFLPGSLEMKNFSFSTEMRPNCKLVEIESEIIDMFHKREIKKIKKQGEFIPFSRFIFDKEKDSIGQGGFGIIYKAKWKYFDKYKNKEVIDDIVLKSFLPQIDKKILIKEFANHIALGSSTVTTCHGTTRDDNGDYYLVMDYYKDGDLRKYLKNEKNFLSPYDKYEQLLSIIKKLYKLHRKNFVHRDFHPGNILLNYDLRESFISDLGLSNLIHKQNLGKVVGILPYIAPEILQGHSYTSASDIYSFGMIMYEVLTGFLPFYDKNWDDSVFKKAIIGGLRPEITVKIIPQLEEIIKSCWQNNPQDRPKTKELEKNLINLGFEDEDGLLESEAFNHPYQTNLQLHPSVSLTSKWWNVSKQANLQLNQEKKDQINLLESQLNSLKSNLDSEQQSLFDEFVKIRKEFLQNQENKELKEKMKSVNQLMKKDESLKRLIKEVNKYCDEMNRMKGEKVEFQEFIEQPTK
jgi:serine/threonine protein kinase